MNMIERLNRLAWPSYECLLCVGQEPHHGCYCAYYDAPAPMGAGDRPQVWREALRYLLAVSGANRRRWAVRDQTVVLRFGRSWMHGPGMWSAAIEICRLPSLHYPNEEGCQALVGWSAELVWSNPFWDWQMFRRIGRWCRLWIRSDASEIVRRRAVQAGLAPTPSRSEKRAGGYRRSVLAVYDFTAVSTDGE